MKKTTNIAQIIAEIKQHPNWIIQKASTYQVDLNWVEKAEKDAPNEDTLSFIIKKKYFLQKVVACSRGGPLNTPSKQEDDFEILAQDSQCKKG